MRGFLTDWFLANWQAEIPYIAALAAASTAMLLWYWRHRRYKGDTPLPEEEIDPPKEDLPIDRAPLLLTLAPAFIVEAFVSAGRQKSRRDYEDIALSPYDLCEDSAGVVALQGAYLWWLSDGTSDGSFLGPIGKHAGLTTRMLARDLGAAFVDAQRRADSPIHDRQADMFDRIHQLWQERVAEYLRQISAAGHWENLRNHFPLNSAGSLVFEWSSTFLGGVLQVLNGAHSLSVWQSGDSGALVLAARNGTRKTEIIAPTSDRIKLRVIASEPEAFSLEIFVGRQGQMPMYHYDGVEGFFAMSDGLTKGDLDNYLVGLQAKAASHSAQVIRDGLLQRRDKSYDDKSLVVGRLL